MPKFEVGDIVVFTEEMLRKSKIAQEWAPQGPLVVKRVYSYDRTITVTRLDGGPFTVPGWGHTLSVGFGAGYFRHDVFFNAARKAIQNAR